jgi:hypothetical protein
MKNPDTVEAGRGFKGVNCNTINLPRIDFKNKSSLRQDAKVLQFLKRECCQRNDTGAVTLEEVSEGFYRSTIDN